MRFAIPVLLVKRNANEENMPGVESSRDLYELASMIYAESAKDSDYKTRLMMGSTALNRLYNYAPENFGDTLYDVLYKPNAYYAITNQNERWLETRNRKFTDERGWKQCLQIASGLLRGTIKPLPGQFFIKPSEKPDMNWKLLELVGKIGGYNVYAYKLPKAQRVRRAKGE